MSRPNSLHFKQSKPLSLGVELELQLVSLRNYDLTRAASDLLSDVSGNIDGGEIKLEITESMIEINTHPRPTVDGIAKDLRLLQKTLQKVASSHNIGICGGGNHPFHHWPDRRICPVDRFESIYQKYGYLAKQFTVFGQHIHVGCDNAEDAIWLVQAMTPYVPLFIALSAASPFVDGEDSLFKSSRQNTVAAFPLSGQCPPMDSWADFCRYYDSMRGCGVISSIKDLYWDIRPKPEFGTIELRVCDTPLTLLHAVALTGLAQTLCCQLLAERPETSPHLQQHTSRFNKFQASRFGLDGVISNIETGGQITLKKQAERLFAKLEPYAKELGNEPYLEHLTKIAQSGKTDSDWLREKYSVHGTVNDVVKEACIRFWEPDPNLVEGQYP